MSNFAYGYKRKNLRQRELDVNQPLQIFHGIYKICHIWILLAEELPEDDQADSYRGMKILGSGMTAEEEAEVEPPLFSQIETIVM